MTFLAGNKSKSPVVEFEHSGPEAADCPHFTDFILFMATFRTSVFYNMVHFLDFYYLDILASMTIKINMAKRIA